MTTIEVGGFYKTDKGFKVEVIAIRGPDIIFISKIDTSGLRGLAAGVESMYWASGNWSEWIDEPAIPWDSVPEWCQWWAVDLCGNQCFFEKQPHAGSASWFVDYLEHGFLNTPKSHRIPYTGDWRESLRQRPGKEAK